MMAQWHACKAKAPSAILFFRLGDFYEAFYDDALLISKELDLTLTKRQEIPMAGVPAHTCESYIDKLVAKGYRIAVAEQIEDPKAAKGLVKREIVRIVTPGSVINSSLLADKESNYLAALTKRGNFFGLALLDITTAQLQALECTSQKELVDALSRLRPKELLMPEKWKNDPLVAEIAQLIRPSIHFAPESHFAASKRFSIEGTAALVVGALLTYLQELNLPQDHIQSVQLMNIQETMQLDRATQRNLELIVPLNAGQKESTLLHLLDETKTAMGGRLLRHWITHPLLSVETINARQQAIELFFHHFAQMLALRRHLDQIRDLERLMMRIETGFATPRDLVALRYSLEEIPPLLNTLQTLPAVPLTQKLTTQISDPSAIARLIAEAIEEEPPLRLSDGGVFKKGYRPELDALLTIKSDSREWVAAYQTQLRNESGIKTLKVGYTHAFGYFIEVSRGALDKIPPHFHRKQTLTNAERYITPQLKDFEHQILSADERILALESKLFQELRTELTQHRDRIRQIASSLAQIDCLLALAKVAKERGYVRPKVDESHAFSIEAGRHPVIEAHLSDPFIPNDLDLNPEKQLALITGPNMAGKSTFIRQAALIAILAQIGSFIPATSARIGLIDKLFCRIGASDDLARGQSTFMVEMTETAHILQSATSRSLVILDEIGRGTSTYDGISIAWAVAEYLLTTPGKRAKTLFATHYWEMTELALPGAFNLNVTVHETGDGVVFLHKIAEGAADKSYGIHVARLAGLPMSALKRAEEKLKELENTQPVKKSVQLDLFGPSREDERARKMVAEIEKLEPNAMTPLEALQTLMRLKNGEKSTMKTI